MPWKHSLSLGLAVFTCPCHLPLLVGVLVGTALGGWLSQHALVVTLGMAGIFLLALSYGVRALTRQKALAAARADHEAATHTEELRLSR
jgi:mercuric ion transport protein